MVSSNSWTMAATCFYGVFLLWVFNFNQITNIDSDCFVHAMCIKTCRPNYQTLLPRHCGRQAHRPT